MQFSSYSVRKLYDSFLIQLCRLKRYTDRLTETSGIFLPSKVAPCKARTLFASNWCLVIPLGFKNFCICSRLFTYLCFITCWSPKKFLARTEKFSIFIYSSKCYCCRWEQEWKGDHKPAANIHRKQLLVRWAHTNIASDCSIHVFFQIGILPSYLMLCYGRHKLKTYGKGRKSLRSVQETCANFLP